VTDNQFHDEQEMVFDPTEYDPNSKDITDDPNFPEPKCGVCGVPWACHMGIMGVCLWNKALKEDLKDLREEIAQLTKERDEARRGWCIEICVDNDKEYYHAMNEASERGWDCFKKEETP
jgi:hypothetical protein